MQPGEVADADRRNAAGFDDALHGFCAKAGYAQKVLATGAIDVEREAVAVAQRPGEFRVHVQ
jgi:hypothetical protein